MGEGAGDILHQGWRDALQAVHHQNALEAALGQIIQIQGLIQAVFLPRRTMTAREPP